MTSQRSLEQAVGRSGRQGQRGSATIYTSESDRFMSTPGFKPGHDNLLNLELRFSQYVRDQWGWIYEGPGKYGFGEDLVFPFRATTEEILDIMKNKMLMTCVKDAANVDYAQFKDLSKKMVLAAWGTFFDRLCNNIEASGDTGYCEREYQHFLELMHSKLPKGSGDPILYMSFKELDEEEIVVAGVIIASTMISIAFPAIAPIISIASGVLLEGGLEVYKKLKVGEPIDWPRVIIKATGGGLKGGICSIGKGAKFVGIGVGGTATIEDCLCNFAHGDFSLESMRNAVIKGGIEGTTAFGISWVGNKVSESMRPSANKQFSRTIEEAAKGRKPIDLDEIIRGKKIPSTLSAEEKEAADAVGLVMKGEEKAVGTKGGAKITETTAELLRDAKLIDGHIYVRPDVLNKIGAIEAKGGNGFSGLTSTVRKSKIATWLGNETGGIERVLEYRDSEGLKFVIHEVTDGVGNIVHRDFDAVRIASGQVINKLK